MKYDKYAAHVKDNIGLGKIAIVCSIALAIGDLFFHNMMGGALFSALAGAGLFYEAYIHQVRYTEFIIDQYEGNGISKYL